MPNEYTPDPSQWHATFDNPADADDAAMSIFAPPHEQAQDNIANLGQVRDFLEPDGARRTAVNGGGVKNIRRGSQADMVALTPTDGDLFIIDGSPYNPGLGLYEYRAVVPLQPPAASASAFASSYQITPLAGPGAWINLVLESMFAVRMAAVCSNYVEWRNTVSHTTAAGSTNGVYVASPDGDAVVIPNAVTNQDWCELSGVFNVYTTGSNANEVGVEFSYVDGLGGNHVYYVPLITNITATSATNVQYGRTSFKFPQSSNEGGLTARIVLVSAAGQTTTIASETIVGGAPSGPGGGQRLGSFSRWTFRSWKTG